MLDFKRGLEDLGPVDYDKPPPDTYRCSSCQQKGRRLWRDYNAFLDNQFLLCLSCAKVHTGKDLEAGYDQIGGLVPAVPTEEGDTYWGYSSVPTPGVAWWHAMAENCTSPDGESDRLRRRLEIYKKHHKMQADHIGYLRKDIAELRERSRRDA